MFQSRYADVFKGDEHWQAHQVDGGQRHLRLDRGSTYVQNPPYFEGMAAEPAPIGDINGARILAMLGDSITTDHISPGRLHQEDLARRRVPGGAPGPAGATSTPTAPAAATTRS